jgi:chromate reductase
VPQGGSGCDDSAASVIKVLAISGSLRAASINSALLRAAARLAPQDMSVLMFRDLGSLPLFNPDLDRVVPDIVANFRRQVADADALIIASPEYAHGVTGAIKNALDWLVSFEPFTHKPIAVFNASPRAHHADDALRETLRTMAGVIVEPASITIPILGSNLDEDVIVSTPSIAAPLQGALQTLCDSVRNGATAHNRPEAVSKINERNFPG